MCGFAYKGIIPNNNGSFATIKCPNCGQETHNFDESYAVDELDKAENITLDYQESEFETND